MVIIKINQIVQGVKSSLSSIFDIISSESKDEDEDENEKTAHELYQDGIEGIKSLKLPGEIESRDEKSQIYLENNLNKIKNIFSDTYDINIKGFLSILLKKKKRILTMKYFHIKLMILILTIDIIHCTII